MINPVLTVVSGVIVCILFDLFISHMTRFAYARFTR